MYTTIHLRQNPYTLANGTNPMGPYGSGFSEKALIWDIGIYFVLLMLVIFGCCNKRQYYKGLEPDHVENEEEKIEEERSRIKSQLDGFSTKESNDALQVYNLVKQYNKPDPKP